MGCGCGGARTSTAKSGMARKSKGKGKAARKPRKAGKRSRRSLSLLYNYQIPHQNIAWLRMYQRHKEDFMKSIAPYIRKKKVVASKRGLGKRVQYIGFARGRIAAAKKATKYASAKRRTYRRKKTAAPKRKRTTRRSTRRSM